MKSTSRMLSLLCTSIALILGVSIAPALNLYAQDNCFGLKADDCSLVTAASGPDAYAKLTSFNFTYTRQFSGSGTTGQGGNFSETEKGSYSNTTPVVTLATPPATEAANANNTLMLENTINITNNKNGTPGKAQTIEVRIVNGTFYLGVSGRWLSLPLDKAQSGGLATYMVAFGDPLEFINNLKAGLDALASGGVISAERSADLTIDNQKIGAFVYHFDLAKAASTDNFRPILNLFAITQSQFSKIPDDVLAANKDKLANALRNSQLTITRYIGVTDKLPHGVNVNLSINIAAQDLASIAAIMGSGNSSNTGSGPLTASIQSDFQISGIGTTVNVTPPPNAIPMPGLPSSS